MLITTTHNRTKKNIMHLLELKGVKKSYVQGGFFGRKRHCHVLQDVNLVIDSGTCVGLLGRSGSGKSTLSRIALGLESPDAGKVLFNGKSLSEMKKQDRLSFRKNMQVVFQNSLGSVNPGFTAGQIIAEPLQNFESLNSKALQQKLENLIIQVGLSVGDLKKYPHQFSGGELQRICIARAIALKPKLIVLDEAVSSLDMIIQAKIINLLVELQQQLHIAYLFISHDLRVLLKMTDRLAVMDKGRIVEQVDIIEETILQERQLHTAFTELMEAILPKIPKK